MTRIRKKHGIAVQYGFVTPDGSIARWSRLHFRSIVQGARVLACRPSQITEAIRVRGLAGGFAWRKVGTPAFSKLSRREMEKAR